MYCTNIIDQKAKGESTISNLDLPKNQLQLSDEEDHEDYGLSAKLHGTPMPNNYNPQKWPTFAPPCSTPLTFKQPYARFRDGFGQESPPKMRAKRSKGDHQAAGSLAAASKYRHSKVSTPKGLRDRRVRLSANTAIEFYDVQDRLGFDRPSKAIDWLMQEAKTAIDALGEGSAIGHLAYQAEDFGNITGWQQEISKFPNLEYHIRNNEQHLDDNPNNNLSFLSMICGSNSSTNSLHYQHDLDSRTRTSSQPQDLCLSLQSLQQDPPTLVNQNLSIPYPFDEQGLEHNQVFCQGPKSLKPTLLLSMGTPQLHNVVDYNPMPAFNASLVTRTGLAYNEFSVSPQIPDQEEGIDPAASIKSSATTSFLHYQY